MLSRRVKYSTGSAIIVLIVLGIIVVVNFLSTRHFARADLTQNKDFTVSDATKKVLNELDDIININAYFSKNLPPYLRNLEQQVNDVLDEYKAFARGNLVVDFIDPAGDQVLEQKVRFMGIPQAQLNIVEKDKSEVVNVYFGMAVMYEDRKEIIPVVQNVMTLEYDLTSAIIKVKRSEAKTIGFLSGHKEYSTEEDYEELRISLEKQYKVVNVDVSGGKRVPNDVNTLVIGGPKEKLSEHDKYEIDQFLMRGGRIVFLIDPIDIDSRGLAAIEIDAGLTDMLEHYGVKTGDSLVVDRASNANASFSSGYVRYSMPYPFWSKVTKRQFSQDSPMVNQLEDLVLPWTGSVELDATKVATDSEAAAGDAAQLRGIEICKTSQYSWLTGKPFNLSPQQRLVPTGDMKNQTLAVAVSGRFGSFYADKPVPLVEESEAGTSEAEPAAETIRESPETQIIVVGNARFATSGFLAQFRYNRLFFENAVDWLTLGEDLISIRSRFVTDRPLKEISENAKLFVRIINICGASFLVIAFGLVRFIFKRRAKKIFETYSALSNAG